MESATKANNPVPTNEPLSWQAVTFFRPKFELEFEDRTVASFRSRFRFGTSFEGSYDGVHVIISAHAAHLVASVIETKTGKKVASLKERASASIKDYPTPPVDVTIGENTFIVHLEESLGYFFTTQDGRRIGLTKFNRKTSPISSTFTLLSYEISDPNIWLVALISFYLAFDRGSGWM